ncbi:hypothetical protein Unana1_07420 [Umbelopsis nana]
MESRRRRIFSSYESKAPSFSIGKSGEHRLSPPRSTASRLQTPIRHNDITHTATSESRFLSPLDESVMSNSFHGFTSPASRTSMSSNHRRRRSHRRYSPPSYYKSPSRVSIYPPDANRSPSPPPEHSISVPVRIPIPETTPSRVQTMISRFQTAVDYGISPSLFGEPEDDTYSFFEKIETPEGPRVIDIRKRPIQNTFDVPQKRRRLQVDESSRMSSRPSLHIQPPSYVQRVSPTPARVLRDISGYTKYGETLLDQSEQQVEEEVVEEVPQGEEEQSNILGDLDFEDDLSITEDALDALFGRDTDQHEIVRNMRDSLRSPTPPPTQSLQPSPVEEKVQSTLPAPTTVKERNTVAVEKTKDTPFATADFDHYQKATDRHSVGYVNRELFESENTTRPGDIPTFDVRRKPSQERPADRASTNAADIDSTSGRKPVGLTEKLQQAAASKPSAVSPPQQYLDLTRDEEWPHARHSELRETSLIEKSKTQIPIEHKDVSDHVTESDNTTKSVSVDKNVTEHADIYKGEEKRDTHASAHITSIEQKGTRLATVQDENNQLVPPVKDQEIYDEEANVRRTSKFGVNQEEETLDQALMGHGYAFESSARNEQERPVETVSSHKDLYEAELTMTVADNEAQEAAISFAENDANATALYDNDKVDHVTVVAERQPSEPHNEDFEMHHEESTERRSSTSDRNQVIQDLDHSRTEHTEAIKTTAPVEDQEIYDEEANVRRTSKFGVNQEQETLDQALMGHGYAFESSARNEQERPVETVSSHKDLYEAELTMTVADNEAQEAAISFAENDANATALYDNDKVDHVTVVAERQPSEPHNEDFEMHHEESTERRSSTSDRNQVIQDLDHSRTEHTEAIKTTAPNDGTPLPETVSSHTEVEQTEAITNIIDDEERELDMSLLEEVEGMTAAFEDDKDSQGRSPEPERLSLSSDAENRKRKSDASERRASGTVSDQEELALDRMLMEEVDAFGSVESVESVEKENYAAPSPERSYYAPRTPSPIQEYRYRERLQSGYTGQPRSALEVIKDTLSQSQLPTPPRSSPNVSVIKNQDVLLKKMETSELNRSAAQLQSSYSASRQNKSQLRREANEMDVVAEAISQVLAPYQTSENDPNVKVALKRFKRSTYEQLSQQAILFSEHEQMQWKLRQTKNHNKQLRARLLEVRLQRQGVKTAIHHERRVLESRESSKQEHSEMHGFLKDLKQLRQQKTKGV